MALVKAIAVICLMVSFAGAYAQKNDDLNGDEVRLLEQIRIIDLPSPSNEVSLVQIGKLNEAYVQQVGTTSSSVESWQLGNENFISLNPEGYLYSILIIQAGHNNTYRGDVDVYEGDVNVFQVGHFNTVNQNSVIDNANLTIIQIGDGHHLTQERDITHSQGMRIIQRGNGAKAFIR